MWTGSAADGTKGTHSGHGAVTLGGADQGHAAYGGLDSNDHGPLSGNTGWREIDRHLYAISAVFTVGPNPAVVESLAITSDPGPDGIYTTGDEIEVAATFATPVAVQGEPRIRLHLGQTAQSQVWADYERGGAFVIPEPTERVLVNNTVSHPLGNVEYLNSTTTKAAQAFTTGGESDGYRLSSITIWMQITSNETAGDDLTATLNANNNGNPGNALCTLIDPTNFQLLGLPTFEAPETNPCPTLAANTTYFLVVERVDTTTTYTRGVGRIQGVDETSDGAADWSIGNTGHSFTSGSWSETSSEPYLIRVNGAAVPPVQVGTLVKNTGQALNDGTDLDTEVPRLAQSFTTGNSVRGYKLSSIGIRFLQIDNPSTAIDHLTVTLNANDNGNPGAALCTLSDPSRFTTLAVNKFGATACPALPHNATYFVVMERVVFDSGVAISFAETFSQYEDAGGAAGWSVANTGRFRRPLEAWASLGVSAYMIEVNGVAVPTGVDPDPLRLFFSYTVQADDESDTDGIAVGVAGETNAIDLNGGSIVMVGSSLDAVLGFTPLPSQSGHRVNWVRPTLVGAETSSNGRRVFLTFSEDLNPAARPPTSLFTVTVNGEAVTPSGAAATIQGRVVLLRLATPLSSAAQTVTVSYADPSADDDTAAVEDREGNDALSFTDRPVTNRSGLRAELFPGSSLIPDGLGVGDSFRLLFLTSSTRDATATDIEVYNAFVQAAAAGGRADIRDYSSGFLAVASTAADDARDNTATTGTGVPIYWLGGNKVADDYADFYDGTWDDELNPTDESGSAYNTSTLPQSVWTGSSDDGTGNSGQELGTSEFHGLGYIAIPSNIAVGATHPNPIDSNAATDRNPSFPLYALSEVFTVVDLARITAVEIASDPGPDGNYLTGDEVEVAVTFGREVDVAGNPRIKLLLGESAATERWAGYDGQVLVKNTAQEPFSGGALTASRPRLAQRFITADDPGGYTLSEIGIRFHTIGDPATAGADLTVTLNADTGGEPGAAVCTLNDPAGFRSSGLHRFGAAGCPTLALETAYFVVVERTGFSAGTIAVWHTASAGEDGGGVAGWSIGDAGQVYRASAGSWSAEGAPILIKVGGELVDPGYYRNKVLISNTGQTVRGEFSPVEGQSLFASRFETGGHRLGYRLNSIGFAMGTITDPSTAGDKLRVKLHAEQGFPGHELCTLSPPSSFSENAVNRFGASSCPVLAPQTDYYVAFERLTLDAAQEVEFSTTSSHSNDAAVAGWSFQNVTYAYGAAFIGTGWDISDFGITFRVELSGRPLSPDEQPEPPEPPAQPQKQVANTGQTGLVSSALTSTPTKHAQAFTTGTDASGYRMDSVGIGFRTVTHPRNAGKSVYVTLHEGGNVDPGALFCRLDDNVAIQANIVTAFENLGQCPRLEPNTTYFVVVERHTVTAGETIETSAYTSDNEDAARPGWSIADDSRVYDGSAWSSGGGSSLAIDVRAVTLPTQSAERGGLVPGPVGDLVKNTGQPIDEVTGLSTANVKVGQGFTTGANEHGYRLSSIGLDLYGFTNLATLANLVTVTLHADNNGNPGDSLCTLSDATSAGNLPVLDTFPAPDACPALAASTTYIVVIERVLFNTLNLVAGYTMSGDEDDGGAPGWSIENEHLFFPTRTMAWDKSASGSPLFIEVRGSALRSGPTVSNTGQTLEMRMKSLG